MRWSLRSLLPKLFCDSIKPLLMWLAGVGADFDSRGALTFLLVLLLLNQLKALAGGRRGS